jgi:hypothetical protein
MPGQEEDLQSLGITHPGPGEMDPFAEPAETPS